MKRLLCIYLLFFGFSIYAQALIKQIPLNLDQEENVFRIVENDKNQVTFFFRNSERTICMRYDNNFNLTDSLSVKNSKNSGAMSFAGYSQSENSYSCFLKGSNSKNVLSINFNFNNKKVSENSFRIEYENEKILKAITVNNVFYIVSIIKKSSLLNFYSFKNEKLEKHLINLSDKRFLDRENKAAPLWDLVAEITDFEPAFSFQTITFETPSSIVLSANKRKMYAIENHLVFSMDTNKKFTQTFSVDLTNFSVNQRVYSQPFFEDKNSAIKEANGFSVGQDSNSFLFKKYLVQIKSTDNTIKFSVKNLIGEELKYFTINPSEEISFRNSEIYQENGSFKTLKTIDKSDQFIRKLSNLSISLSLFEVNNQIQMTFGGVSLEQQSDGISIGVTLGGLTGVLIGATFSSGYSIDSLNSYKNRKVVYVNCLFDNEFNHIEEVVKTTAFDRLREFSENNSHLVNTTVFKINSDLYLAGYDFKNKSYSFYKFKD